MGMSKLFLKILLVGLAVSTPLFFHASDAMAGDEETKEEEVKNVESKGAKKDSLMERIDFGNSYILGQSIKSGAVYLLHRKKSDIKSMLKTREDYREEILEDFNVDKESDDKEIDDNGNDKP